ncbi:MAG: glycogen debranching enzyme family protein [Spirochaetales bacterium]|nr:glycogen debranching enzyme family protein [Spirochaetales bacterium]
MNNINGPFELDNDLEWLETNQAGAFCCSTVLDCPSRKYHGLLVTPIEGAEGRYHILSSVDAAVSGKPDYTLGTSRYPMAVHPESYKNLDMVELLPWPAWRYRRDGLVIRKEVFMCPAQKAVYLVFLLEEGAARICLDLKFLFTFRNSHNLTRKNNDINPEIRKGDRLRLKPYEGMPEVEITFSGEWSQEGDIYWDYNIEYPEELERGLEYSEDRFVPGQASISLNKGTAFVIRVAVEQDSGFDPGLLPGMRDEQLKMRQKDVALIDRPEALLRYNARHFMLVNPSGKKSVNAGYPWFGEWGRDTMIALPGLTCYNGHTDSCVDVLCDYISMIKDGLLPNTLGETQGYTSYNSIDAGLLFCRAVINLMKTGYGVSEAEKKVLHKRFLPAVEGLVDAFIQGRVPGTRLNSDGLISSGNRNTQLTWMDATAWGHPVTPRCGFAVDINALWFDALCLCRSLSEAGGKRVAPAVIVLLESIPESFRKMFWIDDGEYLTDTVYDGKPDYKIRPNMLFASSATEGLLDDRQKKAVVAAAQRHLLTPLGLRTLSPEDEEFCPYYTGGPDERDSRYHQGTVWPWLLGIMIESSINCSNEPVKIAESWAGYLDNLLKIHLNNQGWGFISEIFDGRTPGKGKGCFAQAWSSGEIIRAYSIIQEVLK